MLFVRRCPPTQLAGKSAADLKAGTTFDGQGRFAIPGLIDGNFHIDSQLVLPTALSRAMVSQGTTSVVAEFSDVVGAAGKNGMQAATVFFRHYEKLPYRIHPFAPGEKVDVAIVKLRSVAVARGDMTSCPRTDLQYFYTLALAFISCFSNGVYCGPPVFGALGWRRLDPECPLPTRTRHSISHEICPRRLIPRCSN